MPIQQIDELPVDFLAYWAPKERIPPAEWVMTNIFLDAKTGAATPGYWSHTKFPYSRGVLETLDDPDVERVVMDWGTRLGKTTVIGAYVAWLAENDPCNVGVYLPDQKMAHEHYKTKLNPVLDACEAIRRRRPAEGERHMELVDLDSMWVMYGWCGGLSTISGRSLRVVCISESNLWKFNVDVEGDRLQMAIDRSKEYPNRKIIIEGKPTVEGECRITGEYERSNQQLFFVPCPHCGVFQTLEFGNEDSPGGLKWDRAPSGESDIDIAIKSTRYVCPHCKGEMREAHKIPMVQDGVWAPKGQPGKIDEETENANILVMRDGVWVPKGQKVDGPLAPAKSKRVSGFHLNSLYSPAVSWAKCVQEWLEACQSKANKQGMIHSFLNSWLALPYKRESKTLKEDEIWAHSFNTGYKLGEVPASCLALIATVDVQADCFWYVIRAWGWLASSWLVRYGRVETWWQLASVMEDKYDGAHGEVHAVRPRDVWIDSGYRTQEVYEECLKRGWVPIKGDHQYRQAAVLTELTAVKDRLKGWNIDSGYAFDRLYESRLAIKFGDPGYWALPEDVGRDYVRSLVSFKKDKELKPNGDEVFRWVSKSKEYEHLADLEKYQEAAAFKYGFAFKKRTEQSQRAPELGRRGAASGPGGW